MADDYKDLYVLPARGNGKSMLQAKIYEELLKGENNMFNFKGFKGDSELPTTVGVDLAEEEWVWVKGFKGTDKNIQCRGMQYTIGEQQNYDGTDKGFHFCKELRNVFSWYKIGDGHRFFEVEALVRKKDLEPDKEGYILRAYASYRPYMENGDKLTSKSIRFIRELSVDEVFAALGDDTVNWSEDMKKRAMETSLETIRAEPRVEELVAAGYSRTFATYISCDLYRCKTALAVASLPDVSMDVKVMAIFMHNND